MGQLLKALTGATIYADPTEEPIRDGAVLIDGATIAAVGPRLKVPANARRLDCSGLTITAGFWNSHVHFFERKWADAAGLSAHELGRQLREAFTRFGFTSVFDIGSMWENTRRIRERIESGEIAGPAIRSTGEGLLPKGGAPPEHVIRMMGVMNTPLPEIGDANEAAAVARRLLESGVDGIKLFLAPAFPDGAIEAAADEAHRSGKLLFVHPQSASDVLKAARGRADIIAHTTPQSGAWNDDLLQAMRGHSVALTPTLTLWKNVMRHDRLSAQERFVSAALDQLRSWIACGGQVLFGTDLGAVDYDPTEEYALMSEAGMTFTQILESLTTAPARRFGEATSGRIAPGCTADLVVLRSDPAPDVRALGDVRYTLRSGEIVYSTERA